MATKGIDTLRRYLYLNLYGFILLAAGVCAASVPFIFSCLLWVRGIGIVLSLLCWKGAWKIFSSWKSKRRIYDILMRRNTQGLIPWSFREYVHTPCGRLMTRLVLRDLRREESIRWIQRQLEGV